MRGEIADKEDETELRQVVKGDSQLPKCAAGSLLLLASGVEAEDAAEPADIGRVACRAMRGGACMVCTAGTRESVCVSVHLLWKARTCAFRCGA